VVSVSIVAWVEASVFDAVVAFVLALVSDEALWDASFRLLDEAFCEALFAADASASVLEWLLVELLADPTPEVVRALVWLPAVDEVAPPPEALLVWVELPPDEELPPLPLEAVALVALADEVSFEELVLLAFSAADDVVSDEEDLLALSIEAEFLVAFEVFDEV
jgi:hypothetical protein